ncbi:ParB/RepB/Spo0J family partition protein [Clostridium aminobutyricum]|uniref:ParB/RepB/Spo0J family partition protein n=1 Tax=Clostridium aminobutyricum TaxID=33953 RepID=A0A939IJ77_CLOAM|nr:ParB/RepB/Spo0J family partition protein [Clostridium aminobutyricum]MBN7773323.1 ParB/RepB/Spo0J family partition protein [Clostridium aminobutyricum]
MATPKNRGLGRGLEELFSAVEINASQISDNTPREKNSSDTLEDRKNTILYLDINDIKPNINQPRKRFDDEKIDELATSIETYGVIQPIVIRPAEVGYEIVAGERRWRAARKANLKVVPCILKELTEEENMVISIIENMQREDLNPIEEAEALQQMVERFGLSQEQISKNVGKSRPYITNSLRLLKLPIPVRNYVIEGKLTNGHARAIAGIADEDTRIAIADKVAEEGLSVREVESLINSISEPKTKKQKEKREKAPDILMVEAELKEIMGTKVNLKLSGNNKGKIEIEYYNREELERLIEFLRGLTE